MINKDKTYINDESYPFMGIIKVKDSSKDFNYVVECSTTFNLDKANHYVEKEIEFIEEYSIYKNIDSDLVNFLNDLNGSQRYSQQGTKGVLIELNKDNIQTLVDNLGDTYKAFKSDLENLKLGEHVIYLDLCTQA